MRSLVLKRIIAFGLDYLLGVIYGVLLYLATTWINPPELSMVQGQLVGFFFLTLPVFLYFYLMEKSDFRATVGKRIMGICLERKRKSGQGILWRNVLKFLPWEIAHAGVHGSFYFSNHQLETPLWVWILLILPQMIVLTYIISILYSKGNSSLYDHYAGTQINAKAPDLSK